MTKGYEILCGYICHFLLFFAFTQETAYGKIYIFSLLLLFRCFFSMLSHSSELFFCVENLFLEI
jgi:hypothetical protein